MPCRLHGVRVKQDAPRAADRADLGNGLDRADLVVGVHDRHKTGVVPNGVCDLLGQDDAVFTDGKQRDLKPLPLQLFECVQDRVMLERGGDDVHFSLPLAEPRGAQKRLIVGLAAAGGEGDLSRGAAETVRHALPRRGKRLGGSLTERVQAGRVAILLLQIREHGFDGGTAHFGRRRVIQINSFHMSSVTRSGRTQSAKSGVER